jgi:hypothetical protein
MNVYTKTNDNGTKFYYKDKKKTILHREDGPAVVYSDGDKSWYLNGKRHRMDGPAIEYINGSDRWYIDGVFIFKVDQNGNVTGRME